MHTYICIYMYDMYICIYTKISYIHVYVCLKAYLSAAALRTLAAIHCNAAVLFHICACVYVRDVGACVWKQGVEGGVTGEG